MKESIPIYFMAFWPFITYISLITHPSQAFVTIHKLSSFANSRTVGGRSSSIFKSNYGNDQTKFSFVCNAVETSNDTDDSLPNLSNEEISRYSRHLVLGAVGMKGQRQIKNGSVLCVGAGGLGSPCLLYLAAAGVGRIGIVDADTVDESNLQRQIIHTMDDVGVSKCESAAASIKNLNPNCEVVQFKEEFTSESALRILNSCPTIDGDSTTTWDVVVDGSDNFPTKYLINDACEILSIPWVYSAILAFEGQISTFNFKGGPTYRDLLPTPPNPGDVPSCAEGGVLGVLPGTFGCMQATEVVKILLGKESGLLSGRVLVWDAIAMKFSEISLKRDEERQQISELIDYKGFCAGPKGPSTAPLKETKTTGRTMDEIEGSDASISTLEDPYHTIAPKDCLSKLAGGWTPWVLDVRLQTENDIIALPFTDRVSPHRQVSPGDIPSKGDVLVYCKAGVRGKKAIDRLMTMGVDGDRLYNLDGGIMRWQKDVDKSMPRY